MTETKFDLAQTRGLTEKRYRPVSWAEFCEVQDALAAACDEIERMTAERDAARDVLARCEPWSNDNPATPWKFYCVVCGESYDNVAPPEFPEHAHKDDCIWARSVVALRQAQKGEGE